MKKLLVFVLATLISANLFAAGTKEAKDLVDVRVGIHANNGGAPLAAIAQAKGFFAEYGINPKFTIVESGPAEMTAMRADNRTLDVGYIGAGVAWNPIDGAGNQLSFVFLDCLSNAEVIVAKTGIFVDSNKNKKYDAQELANGLRNRKVYMEVGTTPGGWFKNLLELINAELPTNEQVWIECETSSYLAGYKAPNNNPANKVTVVNTLNSNLPAGMATGGGMDIVCGFSPATGIIIKSNKNTEIVASTVKNFPPEKVLPSTWVASNKWIEENPTVAQNFINALYKAALYRSNNMQEAMSLGESLSQKPAGSFDPSELVAPTKEEYTQWFSATNARGYAYMKALYDSKIANVPKGNPVKTFEESFNDTFIKSAIKSVK